MKYQIVAFNQANGRISVEYEDGEVLNIDLPIVKNTYITGEELDKFIVAHYPVGSALQKQRERALKNVKNPNVISSMVKGSGFKSLVGIDPIIENDLESCKLSAQKFIDAEVDKIRGRFTTTIRGQDLVYYLKREQAKKYREANYEGDVPAYIQQEADALGKTPKEVAEAILDAADFFDLVSAQIESLRVAAKAKIREATANLQVRDLLEQYIKAIREAQ